MPVFKCNGKYRVGTGKCVFKTKSSAESALRAIKANQNKRKK